MVFFILLSALFAPLASRLSSSSSEMDIPLDLGDPTIQDHHQQKQQQEEQQEEQPEQVQESSLPLKP